MGGSRAVLLWGAGALAAAGLLFVILRGPAAPAPEPVRRATPPAPAATPIKVVEVGEGQHRMRISGPPDAVDDIAKRIKPGPPPKPVKTWQASLATQIKKADPQAVKKNLEKDRFHGWDKLKPEALRKAGMEEEVIRAIENLDKAIGEAERLGREAQEKKRKEAEQRKKQPEEDR